MIRAYLPISTLAIFSLLTLVPVNQYATAVTPSVTVSGTFLHCCYGFLQIQGSVTNAAPGTWVQVQVYAPNNQLVLDDKIQLGKASGQFTAHFGDGLGISRDQGKGDYRIIATYLNHFSAQTQVPSWINDDPVVNVSATEFSDGSVFIQGRILNSIAGEQYSISITDSTGSTTATYTGMVGIQGQSEQFIDATLAKQVFPTSGDYTITLTHTATGVTGSSILTYTVY